MSMDMYPKAIYKTEFGGVQPTTVQRCCSLPYRRKQEMLKDGNSMWVPVTKIHNLGQNITKTTIRLENRQVSLQSQQRDRLNRKQKLPLTSVAQ